MNKRTITKALQAADRFRELAKVLQNRMDDKECFIVGTKESSAVKRASMDLTRALADMRRPL